MEEYGIVQNKWITLLGLRFTFLGSAFTLFLVVGNKVLERLEARDYAKGDETICYIALFFLFVGLVIWALEKRLKWMYTAHVTRGGQIETQLGLSEVGAFHWIRKYREQRGRLIHYPLLWIVGFLIGLIIFWLLVNHCGMIWEVTGSLWESTKESIKIFVQQLGGEK